MMSDLPDDTADMPEDPVEDLLASCLGATGQELERRIKELCRDNPELADSIRERVNILRDMGMLELGADPNQTPERLGPFQLLDRVGSGGMGAVYLAEQEGLGRKVALKLIRPEHLYFPGAYDRFLREIEVIGGLSHENIVPIYAAGEEDGVPYYAMEFVEGASLSQVIARREFDSAALGHAGESWYEACAKVVLQVGAALEHAHSRDVIHRDVKPSNIMVSASGRVMLLDFGLATQEGLDPLTRSGAQPGSVAYMSPEQVRGEIVDLRTDVYSLGVTMYELLCGRAAFGGDSLEAVRKSVLDARPEDLRRESSELPRDLEVVCQTAMAPEPGRRYATMREFIDDLQAFLTRRPIAARRAGTWLRLRRFTQRRPTLVASLVLGGILLTVGPASLAWVQYGARLRITEEAETARAVTEFMVDLFAEARPDHARGETVSVRVILDRGVRRMRFELTDQPRVRAELLHAMGRVYTSLGLYRDAAPLLEESMQLQTQNGEVQDVKLGRLLKDLGALYSWMGSYPEALHAERRAYEIIEGAEPQEIGELASIDSGLGMTYMRAGNFAAARMHHERAVRRLREAGVSERHRYAGSLRHYAAFISENGSLAEATQLLIDSQAIFEEIHTGDHPDKVIAHQMLGTHWDRMGDTPGAELEFQKALAMAVRVFDPEHPRIAEVKENFAAILSRPDRAKKAEELLASALEVHRRVYPAGHPTMARALSRQCGIQLALGRYVDSERAAREAVEIAAEAWPEGHEYFVRILSLHALALFYTGELDLAAQRAERAVKMFEKLDHPRRDTYGIALRVKATVLATQGSFDGTEELARRAYLILKEWHRHGHPQRALARSRVAYVLLSEGKVKEAEVEARAAIEEWSIAVSGPFWGKGYSRDLLGWALLDQGKAEAAIVECEKSIEIFEQVYPENHALFSFPLNNIGVAKARLKDLQGARVALEKSYAIRQSLPEGSELRIISELNLAAVSQLLKDNERAESLAKGCLARLAPGDRRGPACVALMYSLLNSRKASSQEFAELLERSREVLPAKHKLLAKIKKRVD